MNERHLVFLQNPRHVRRALRLMAGDLHDPTTRLLARIKRQDDRFLQQEKDALQWLGQIKRREDGADDLPPMPLNFPEQLKRMMKR